MLKSSNDMTTTIMSMASDSSSKISIILFPSFKFFPKSRRSQFSGSLPLKIRFIIWLLTEPTSSWLDSWTSSPIMSMKFGRLSVLSSSFFGFQYSLQDILKQTIYKQTSNQLICKIENADIGMIYINVLKLPFSNPLLV